jgi:hypothetical protein
VINVPLDIIVWWKYFAGKPHYYLIFWFKKVQKTEIGLVSPSYTCTIHGIKKAEAETSALFSH